jgi:hypothetical protein
MLTKYDSIVDSDFKAYDFHVKTLDWANHFTVKAFIVED